MKCNKVMLENRESAAIRLKDIIPMSQMKSEDWKVIAMSSGGLVIASHLTKKTQNKIDFLFNAPIYAPNNDECEVARVSESEEIVINEELVSSFGIEYDYIYGEAHRKHEDKILSYTYRYRKGRQLIPLKDKIVLLVDEGSETGSKFMLGLKTVLAMQPKAVYIAVPIIPKAVLEALEPLADNIFYIQAIEDYVQTKCYYENLDDVDNETIEKLLGDKN